MVGYIEEGLTKDNISKTPEKGISVSIIPRPNASTEEAERMENWSDALETLDADAFSDIMLKVRIFFPKMEYVLTELRFTR